MSEAVELEPCPWCGPGNSIPGVWFDDMVKAHRVSCGRCGSGTGFGPRWTADDAIAAWNRRALTKTEGEPVAWRCFHCDFQTADHAEANKHFGPTTSWKPSCQPDGTVKYWREMAASEAASANEGWRRARAAEQPLYTRSPVWPDREAVAKAIVQRLEARGAFSGPCDLRSGSSGEDVVFFKEPAGFKPIDLADAILALPASDGAGQVEGEGE